MSESDALWQKLNEIFDRLSIENELSSEFEFYDQENGTPFAHIKIARWVFENYYRRHFFEELHQLFSKWNEEGFLYERAQYFERFHNLIVPVQLLREVFLEAEAFMILNRVELAIAYIETHVGTMFKQALDAFNHEALLSITEENMSLLEHPEFGGIKPKMAPPKKENVENFMLKPFKEGVKKRLGYGKGKNKKYRTEFNFLEGVLPLYRNYHEVLSRLRNEHGKLVPENENVAEDPEIDALLKEINKQEKDPHFGACLAIIKAYKPSQGDLESAPNWYSSPESLYALIQKATKQEDELVEKLRARVAKTQI